jgi:hypothetical protein
MQKSHFLTIRGYQLLTLESSVFLRSYTDIPFSGSSVWSYPVSKKRGLLRLLEFRLQVHTLRSAAKFKTQTAYKHGFHSQQVQLT